ncbi:DHA2 family efflux MFS transporter permease subunit [Methanorbis rubei]|uniref:Riboflavin transporter RibZ n=1 Tax=Methanorbis rubei TaxID=3028300 RepID=A0AAE4SBG7_9EURY|nr:Riboflavin transporter RibZ [Methanocorpusculaceae archaeon Cs1]
MNVIENPLYQKLLLAAVAIGVIMDGLDGSIVNVVLPVIAADFGTDTGTISWVIITYLLMMAGFLLVFGKFADRGHIRKVFVGGFVIFTIGSAVCGLSTDLSWLLGARMFQGVGAAMIAAAAPMLCVKCLPARMLGFALGVLTMASSIGFAAGPALGGILTHYLSWHWIFLINIPIGIAAIPFALRVIPKDVPAEKKPFDLIGAVLLFAMMVFGIYALERVPHLGLSNPQITLCAAFCLIFAVLFVVRELRCRSPLINIRVFTAWKFSAVVVAFMLINVIYMGVIYLLPFYLHTGMHFDTAASGMYLLIPPALTAVLGIPIGRWSDRTGRRSFAVAACVVLVMFNLIYVMILPEMGVVPLLCALILMGVLWGLAGGPAASRIVENAPEGERGTGSSLMAVCIYLGSVIGTALYATIFTFATSPSGTVVAFTNLDPTTFMNGFHFTILVGLGLAVLAIILSAIVRDQKKGEIES